MRLDRILANSGHGSRKDVRRLIKSGALSLHGRVLKNEAENIAESDLDALILHQEALCPQFSFYFALHKPAGYLTAMEDKKQPTVKAFLPPNLLSVGLFPVGRLDIDTQGLLLFTNDGRLGHRLTKPEWHVEKHYAFSYTGAVLGEAEVADFSSGLKIGDWTCRPAKLLLGAAQTAEPIAGQTAELMLEEGKFHQVKRMVQAVGRAVTSLKRLRHGPIDLQGVSEAGQIRPLSDTEIQALYEATALERPSR